MFYLSAFLEISKPCNYFLRNKKLREILGSSRLLREDFLTQRVATLFKAKGHLSIHMHYHFEQKHTFVHCNKKFHTSSNLKEHMKINFEPAYGYANMAKKFTLYRTLKVIWRFILNWLTLVQSVEKVLHFLKLEKPEKKKHMLVYCNYIFLQFLTIHCS